MILLPVRHHSPACSRMVRETIRRVRPAAVLIEGPWDFNDRIGELSLGHTPPFAIYSYTGFSDGTRRGAYYPLCAYSPEWQALLAAKETGAVCRFIDLPYAILARESRRTNFYADDRLRAGDYMREICRALEVDDFDAAWDSIAEHDAALTSEEIQRRVGIWCANSRRMDAEADAVPSSDVQRETFMAACVRAACREFGPDRVIVITGGYHTSALEELLACDDPSTPEDLCAWPEDLAERGLALTPYSYQRLDSLTGYDAGMPSPGFYDRAWQDDERNSPRGTVHRPLLQSVAAKLRELKQPVSTADLIAVETCAAALAALRGHARVWRCDLIDGATAALLKDELTASHPFLLTLQAVLRGDARGQLAAGSPQPPLARDIEARLLAAGLTPDHIAKDHTLTLTTSRGLEQSRLLHSLQALHIPGFRRTGGVDFATRADLSSLQEKWNVGWSPEQTAAIIEASRYGSALPEAVAACLTEAMRGAGRSSAIAAALLLDAVLAGAFTLADSLRTEMTAVLQEDGDLTSVATALRHLLYLYSWDDVLGTRGSRETALLLTEAWQRAVWLLESGSPAQRPGDEVEAVRLIRDATLRASPAIPSAKEELLPLLARVQRDSLRSPAQRGACAGASWSLGGVEVESIRSSLLGFASPDHLGDYLTGLFALAREEAQRDAALLAAIHDVMMEWGDNDFLTALPSLRLAFMYFTPREKDFMARNLFAGESNAVQAALEPAPLEVSVSEAAAAMAFEARLFDEAARLGIQLELQPVTAP